MELQEHFANDECDAENCYTSCCATKVGEVECHDYEGDVMMMVVAYLCYVQNQSHQVWLEVSHVDVGD